MEGDEVAMVDIPGKTVPHPLQLEDADNDHNNRCTCPFAERHADRCSHQSDKHHKRERREVVVDAQEGEVPHGLKKIKGRTCRIEPDEALKLDNME